MYGKSNMETYITMCKIDRYPTGIWCLAQGTQTGALYQPSGWGGEEDGREVQKGGDRCTSMADSC